MTLSTRIKTPFAALFVSALLSLTGCSAEQKTDEATTTWENSVRFIPATDARIAVIGRSATNVDNSISFAYPGVSLNFATTASELTLQIQSSSEQSFIDVELSGQPSQVVRVPADQRGVVIHTGNSGKAQTVRVTHRGETWHGMVSVSGLTLKDGELLAAPQLPERKILVLGDSVTCGEAIERQASCKKDSSWWNARFSYGMLTGEALNAQVNLVCYGGRGLVRSWNGRTDELNLPDYTELAIASAENPIAWDHNRYTPDLILSAIGTNDFSEGIPEADHYIETYLTLIKRLHTLHPNATIAVTEGAILNGEKKAALRAYLQQIAQHSDVPVQVIPATWYPGDDCDAHPTKEQHAAMANDLAPVLRELMNWQD
jgi:lysophospholipase L1-like esterase